MTSINIVFALHILPLQHFSTAELFLVETKDKRTEKGTERYVNSSDFPLITLAFLSATVSTTTMKSKARKQESKEVSRSKREESMEG